jgi:hypothetical protein
MAKNTRRVAMELRWGVRCSVAVLVVCAAIVVTPYARAEEPDVPPLTREAGGGYVVPGTRLWLGGDVTVAGGVPEDGPAFLELDDVSLLARYDLAPRLGFFTELRLENTIELLEGIGVERGSADISIERLYAEALLTPRLTIRGGKFYTPFGLWNVIHRAPLTWTVDAPEIVEETFPIRATGLSLAYQTTWRGWSVDATAYGPAQDKLALRQTPDSESGLMAGGRTAIGRVLGPAWGALGVSAMGFEDDATQRWAQGYGTDVELTLFGHHVMGEFDYIDLHPRRVGRELGFYLQDAIPITQTLYGVLRAEYLELRDEGPGTGGLVGLFWQPRPHLILKADYQFGDRVGDTLEPGFIASVTLFF